MFPGLEPTAGLNVWDLPDVLSSQPVIKPKAGNIVKVRTVEPMLGSRGGLIHFRYEIAAPVSVLDEFSP